MGKRNAMLSSLRQIASGTDYFHQFEIIVERGVRGNICRITRTFAEGWRDDQLPALADLHARHRFVDPCNHLVSSHEESKRLVLGASGENQRAVGKCSGFVDANRLTSFRGRAVSFCDDRILQPACRRDKRGGRWARGN